EVVADPQRHPVAEVYGKDEADSARLDGDAGGTVVAAIDDDNWRDVEAARHLRYAAKHVADVRLLLVGADQGHDRTQLEVGVAVVEVLTPEIGDETLERPEAG